MNVDKWTRIQSGKRLRYEKCAIGGIVPFKQNVEHANEVAIADETDVADRNLLIETTRIWLP